MKYPLRVVVINKLINTVISFLKGRKCFYLQHLFFQGAMKPLYYPVALWRSYKRFGHLQSQEFHFIHKISRVILCSMIASELQIYSFANILLYRSKSLAYSSPDRLHCRKTIAFLCNMPRDNLIIKMIYHTKEPMPAQSLNPKLFPIRGPH